MKKVNRFACSLVAVLGLAQASHAINNVVVYYSFEAPDTAADNVATDNSGNGINGALQSFNGGSATYVADPAPGTGGAQSLRLTGNGGTGSGPVARLQPPTMSTSVIDFDTDSWTMGTFFKRDASSANLDFILHLGSGDGFGGGNEMYVYSDGAAATGNPITLHGYLNSSQNVNITQAGAIDLGEWYHVAIVRDASLGLTSLYLDGILIGSDNSSAMNLDQTYTIGGHDSTTFQSQRFLNGNVDEFALWSVALTADQIAAVAAGRSPLAVPEPATAALGLMGLAGLMLRRRRLA